MSVGQQTAMFLAAATPCFLAAALLLRWARPVNGGLSPRLQRRGVETLVTAGTSMLAMLGLAFVIGAVLGALK
jgi:hypothetical protein